MEVYTCFCREELCNDNGFLLPKFNEWISVTRARLKAGTSHPLDIVTGLATYVIAGFFILIVCTNIPWKKLLGKSGEDEDGSEDEEAESEDKEEKSKAD